MVQNIVEFIYSPNGPAILLAILLGCCLMVGNAGRVRQ